jgi:hypothetical protein
MQTNKRKIWDVVFKPNGLEPLTVSKCLIMGISITDHALSKNYNSWVKLDEYVRWDQYQIEYVVIEESRVWIQSQRYTEESLYPTREDAMEFVYNKAKEILDIEETNESPNNKDSE